MSRSLLLVPAVAAAVIAACFAAACSASASAGSFYRDFDVVWGNDPHPEQRVTVVDGGRLVTLALDDHTGSGFQSKGEFLFGEFTMEMKLVPGDSAGTVTTFYLTSEGDAHDEIDFEFLGNTSGEPYVMQTNVFAQGKGNREQRFYLWFDPRADFHNYTILWNPLNIIFSVDGTPVRVFKNRESHGVPYLNSQAMKVHATLWNGDSWATRGGRVKIDWSHAPFVASYRGYAASACACASNAASCCCPGDSWSQAAGGGGGGGAWMTRRLGPDGRHAVAWAREKYMISDYCDESWQIPQGQVRPAECDIARQIA